MLFESFLVYEIIEGNVYIWGAIKKLKKELCYDVAGALNCQQNDPETPCFSL